MQGRVLGHRDGTRKYPSRELPRHRCSNPRLIHRQWFAADFGFQGAVSREHLASHARQPGLVMLLRRPQVALVHRLHRLLAGSQRQPDDPQRMLPQMATGSIGNKLKPRMAPALRDRCVDAAMGPVEGALWLLQQSLGDKS